MKTFLLHPSDDAPYMRGETLNQNVFSVVPSRSIIILAMKSLGFWTVLDLDMFEILNEFVEGYLIILG